MLATNENHIAAGTPGSGGLVGGGIFFDTVFKTLTINVAWGSANGFADLTGDASAGHIHGPTTSGGAASFTQNAGVIFGLSSDATWNASASSGGITGRTITLDSTQEADLLDGKYYINIHTAANPGGEIRGNLVVIPEPGSFAFALFSMVLIAGRRRR